MTLRTLVALLALLAPALAGAEVVRVSIASRATVADGAAFGAAGAYERLTGTIEFALDPAHPRNTAIVDLAHAPRAADGKVHFTSDVHVLRPVDQARGNGVLLFEIANRGNKLLFNYFHGRGGPNNNDPQALADFGDAFLMREGYTLVWVGWQFDVAPPRVAVAAPPVNMAASPMPDTVRFSFIVDRAVTETAPGDLARYRPAEDGAPRATLTVRDKFWDVPTALPRRSWRIVPTDARPRIVLDSGFEPGRVYELTYQSDDAVVAGVGLAALRDAGSAFLRRPELGIPGRSAMIFGASQSGRLLRQFLLDGFNVDEQGRQVFSMAWAHIAGAGLGSFNERFALPGYSSFPATRTPFLWPDILARYTAAQAPKIVATNTSVEYWGQGRAAALTHTTADGRRDAVIPENVRIYLLAGTQHGEGAFPPAEAGNGQQQANPTPQVAAMRAILRAAHGWSTAGTKPLDSRYPRLADGSLVPVAALAFPRVPGVSDPRTIEAPGDMRDGRFVARPFLVPRIDADGNESAGIRVPEVSVPLATTTGWNFRAAAVGNPGTIYSLLGSYLPFAPTRAAREATGDPRPSIQERYASKDEYLGKIRAAATALIRERYLLQDDLENVLSRASAHWDFAIREK